MDSLENNKLGAIGMFDDLQLRYNQYLLGNWILGTTILGTLILYYKKVF